MKVFYDLAAFNRGIQKRIVLDFERYAHMIICGGTGSGKTYACKLILAKIHKHLEGSELHLCDFKNDLDFSFLKGNERFYSYKETKRGIEEFYERFEARMQGRDVSRNHLFLYVDEYASFINSFGKEKDDKKEMNEILTKMGDLMMMARSFNCHVIVSLQRADADYFPKGARDNFTLRLGLGMISKESKGMLFEDNRDEIVPLGRGKGYLNVDGKPLQIVVVPSISSMDRVNDEIEKFIREGVEPL
ncbi:TPA: hypothetical protein ACQUIL_005638 [Bacillus tropicus]